MSFVFEEVLRWRWLMVFDWCEFTGVFDKLRVSSDYYKRDRTRNLRICCAKVLIENGLKKTTKYTQIA